MPSTYEPIATTTLGSSASSITFSSISSAYTDLRAVIVTTATTNPGLYFQINSTTTGYSQTTLYGNGTSAASTNNTSGNRIYLTLAGNTYTSTPSMYTVDIFNYAGSTYKTMLTTSTADNNGSGTVQRDVGLWQNTAAINTLYFYVGGTFNPGTTITLYGILKA